MGTNAYLTDRKVPEAYTTASHIMHFLHFVTKEETDELFVWTENGLESCGEARVREEIEKDANGYSSSFKKEVIRHIKDRTLVKAERFNPPPHLIPFANVTLDLTTGKEWTGKQTGLEDEERFIIQNELAVEYDPEAPTPVEFINYLKRSQPNADNRTRLLDHFASCLDRRNIRRRALLNVGRPYTGKTTFLKVEEALLGRANCSNISLQEICKGRFATSQVYDKALNFYADLPTVTIDPLDKFKVLTGGDSLQVEFKGRDSFPVSHHVKLHFSANLFPDVAKINDPGFWVRWDLVKWGVVSTSEEEILPSLTEPRQLSGIANMLLGILRRQRAEGFRIRPNDIEVKEAWLGETEPARSWLTQSCERDPNGFVLKQELYDLWESSYRIPQRSALVSQTRFNELVRETLGATEGRPLVAKAKQKRAWLGIRPKNSLTGLTGSYYSKGYGESYRIGENEKNPSNRSIVEREGAP